jgi:hypothetical protein
MEENSLIEPSIDDEAIQSVAQAFPSVTQEQIREVVRLKTSTRMGYRRIGQRLTPPIGKDTVSRIWKMYEASAKPSEPPVEDEELKSLRAQLAEMERLKRIREEKEKLLKQHVLLSLETEGDNLILHIVENDVAKLDSEAYQEFRRYCEHERLSPEDALQEIGVTASLLIDTFDNWYDWFNKHGSSGMECLTCAVWSGLYPSLSAFIEQRATGGSEGKEHGEEPISEPSDGEYEKIGRVFAECSKRKGINRSTGASLTKTKPSKTYRRLRRNRRLEIFKTSKQQKIINHTQTATKITFSPQ